MLKIKKKSHSGIHFKNSYYKIENGLEETGARFEYDQRKELDPCSNPVCNGVAVDEIFGGPQKLETYTSFYFSKNYTQLKV